MKKKNKSKAVPFSKLSPSTNRLKGLNISELENSFVDHVEFSLVKDRFSASPLDLYKALALTVKDRLVEKWIATQQTYHKKNVKRVYYLSQEFLLGRALGNALLNMGLYDNTYKAMEELGFDLEQLRETEPDAGLGNGGLGRLAACFMDSMATLELPAYGYGIRYEYGIFSQSIADGRQIEKPDHWLRYGNPWEIERPEYIYLINYYGRTQTVQNKKGRDVTEWVDTDTIVAMAYDMPIPGYNNNTVNNLRLWSAKSSRLLNLEYFNSGDYTMAVNEKVSSETISKVLYPRDDNMRGRELRLKQEYFLVSATLQDIIRRYKKSYKNNFDAFPKKAAIQLNDTHPSLAIPELMRLLLDIESLDWEYSWNICIETFGYTNHTILPEALELWSVDLLGHVLPRHLQIIFEINRRFLEHVKIHFPGDAQKISDMSIVKEGATKYLRMAHLAIIGSHSVNGVARLHSEIIKKDIFKNFYELWPQKFNNKTNGITQRRWLMLCNWELTELIDEYTDNKIYTDFSHIEVLKKFCNNLDFQQKWIKVKQNNKQRLARLIKDRTGIIVNPESMFDCQIKRIHEYKRQLLNILHVISLYNRILSKQVKNPVPRVIIFSGKAAPGYTMAKLIIYLINSVAKVINTDKAVNDLLKVVFLADYSVTLAEKIIPAADLSQQISTAGMEASGTGNMKLALNGALTIGTLDGANIEIMEEVGKENIFIFGMTAEEVSLKRTADYDPRVIYHNNPELKQTIDMISSGYFSNGDKSVFEPIVNNLLNQGDYYMLLSDYASYVKCHQEVEKVYKNKKLWAQKSILNTASVAKFSSDRTITDYANQIWNVKPVPIAISRS